MNKRDLLILLLLAVSVFCQAKDVTVKSPNGALAVTVSNIDGQIGYSVELNGQNVLMESSLGLVTSIGDLTQGMTMVNVQTNKVEKHYAMRTTKASSADYLANELALTFQNEQGRVLGVTFRVSDDDIAFRYNLSVIHPQRDPDLQRALIYSEASSFNFPDYTTTYLCPMAAPGILWAHARPSYEEVYTPDAPMNVKSQFDHGYSFPCLFRQNDVWVLVSETGTTSEYCGAHLSDYEEGKGYSIAFPDPEENGGNGSAFVGCQLPFETPWRTMTIGSLATLVESTTAYDQVEPRYEASTEYKPGRYTWSWLIWQDSSVNWDDQIQFIDLAATLGFEYCLVDNWWDQQIGRDKMPELVKYAKTKGVDLLLWYSSNGFWNDAPQTPRNCMNTSIAREKEMKWLNSIGVKGIKVDFFGGDKQETLQLYEDILSDANRYGLQVIFHGCTLPRGWEIMYPNYVSSEAVMASENVYFTEADAEREAFDLCMHPFCRNAVATMDWGGIILNRHMSRDNKSRHTRKTTDIFELASGITTQSYIQCAALCPNNLSEVPEFEIDFIRTMPTTWDETLYIDGFPGKYVVLARRDGNQWYVAGLNALKEPLSLTLSLPMFAGQSPDYYVDDKDGNPVKTNLKVDKKGRAKVVIQPNGGIILTVKE